MITKNLLAWQRANYPHVHAARANLVLHALSAPVFVAGLGAIAAGAATGTWPVLGAGLGAVALAVIAQARGHKLEEEPPAPFCSPLDVIARLVVEQLITFPRFVLSGGFARAWRAAGAAGRDEARTTSS